MSDDNDTDSSSSNGTFKMRASLGDLEVEVKGSDEEWVAQQFEESWQARLDESAEMKEAIRQWM